MKLNKFILIILIPAMTLVGISCETWDPDINVDPFNPTETSANFLFNGLLQTTRYVGNEKLYLNNHKMYQWSQLAASLQDEPNDINDLGRSPVWDSYFGMLRSARALETRLDEYTGDPERVKNRRAMLRILLAYRTLRVTDIYGDMPFSEAGRGVEEGNQIFRPKYDSQESVYKSAMDDLKWAVDNAVLDGQTPAGEEYLTYGNNETMFGNNMEKWVKFANAVRLRYALRVSNVDEGYASGIISDVFSNGMLPESHDDQFAFGTELNNINSDLYWSFQFYEGIRLGENAWNHMTEDPNPDGSGIIDPRVFVIYETNDSGLWVPAPQDPAARQSSDLGGHPYNNERRPDPEGITYRGTYSGFNWYLVENNATSIEYHLTYPEACFLRAEAFQRGLASGDAKEWYEKGIKASIEKWYTVATANPNWANPPAMPTDSAMDVFISHPQIAYDAGQGLKQIHIQRWLDLVLQPQEAYHLTRRSGLIPVLPVNNAVSGAPEPMPRRLRYPEDERNNNLENYNAHVGTMNGGDELTTRYWWDVN